MPEDAAMGSGENKNPEIEETRTSIDTLLELLKTRGKSELNSIAVALNVDPRIVENWAKVLENGNLIRITYEVGRMYLEPVNLAPGDLADLKTKTDLSKFILEEDLAVEKISMDKFSKNIDDLNSSLSNIERMYQQKLPDVQKILAEVDKAYAPVEGKKRSMDRIKEETLKDFQDINKRADELYAKLNSFSPKQVESNVNQRLGQLNSILESIDDTQKTINEMERNEAKFFKTIETEIDAQVKEFKLQLSTTRYNADQNLRSNARQLNDLIKGIREQASAAHQLSKEVEGFRKEFERSKHDLDFLKSDFADKYERLRQGMERDSKLVETQAKIVETSIKSIKQGLGDVSKFDEQIKRWRKNMNDMTREVTTTKTEILKLTNQINALDANRGMSVEAKAKALDAITKDSKKTKTRTSKIKNTLKDTAQEIKDLAEGKKV